MTPWERAWRGGKNGWRLHLQSVFSVAVAFVCLASAALVLVNVEAVRDSWSRGAQASVYLQPTATPEQVERIAEALRQSAGVEKVEFFSPLQARNELLKSMDDELLAQLPPDAFPASLEVHVRDADALGRLKQLEAQLTQLPAVDGVETYRGHAERLGQLLAGGRTAALLLAAVVLAAVVSVVASTMRLSLQRRRIEVEVLKLVGATDGYVRRPFLLEGAVQGGVGAALALALLAALFAIVQSSFHVELGALIGLRLVFLPWWMETGLVALGALLGVAAAHGSVRRALV